MSELNPYASKSLYKINGFFVKITPTWGDNHEFIIAKKGKRIKSVRFLCSNGTLVSFLTKCAKNERIKVRFMVRCSEWKEKWYTDLIAMEILPWTKNENKVIRQQIEEKRQDDMEYSRSLLKRE